MVNNLHLYREALILTLSLGCWGILFSFIIGLICSLISYYQIRGLKRIVSIYIELSRNTPLLIQLFFLYFGLPQLGIMINSYTCAIIGLTFLGGGYMAEAIRGGLDSVSRTQVEAGLSVGLTQSQVTRYVIFPQAMAIALPSIGANVIFLLKETSVVSAVALADLMFVAKGLIGMYYKTNESLFMLVMAYLIILLPISLLFTFLERRLRYAGFGR
ncbi:MAG TPA: amino acid ABC transporter permease [Bacilli bacterium]|nr:amino acid ABC transporter permease [Bacilli bacterium]